MANVPPADRNTLLPVRRNGWFFHRIGFDLGIGMITFTVVVGVEGDADVLDDADQCQGPEHDAVDSQVVLFGWVCQVHGRVNVERGGDEATEYDAQSLVGKEQILVESLLLLKRRQCWRELS
jgi:hypothetical protein